MLFGRKKSDEVTAITVGVLAKKIGISTNTLKRRLHETGLIKRCFRKENNYLYIPRDLALEFVDAETLAKPLPRAPRSRQKKKNESQGQQFQVEGVSKESEFPKRFSGRLSREAGQNLTPFEEDFIRAQKVVEVMKSAGISSKQLNQFLITWYKEVKNEQSKENYSPKEG